METNSLTRRAFFGGVGAGVIAITLVGISPEAALADAKGVSAAIKKAVGGKPTKQGKITLETPQIAENGNTVPLSLEVESPMTKSDHVKAVHLFADGNPSPEVATFKFTPQSGAAKASTRVRLAKTQNIVAVAEMSDGSVYQTQATIKVTIGGCGG